MRIERFYSSLKEEVSPLSPDAATLLENQDYIGFFKSCGPNYVRGIRRAQEITAIFKFHSSSRERASEFAANLKVSKKKKFSVSADFSSKSKFSSIANSLEIKIQGYGLGLNQEGAETLVATSLDEYNEAINFAFKSFTQNEDSHNIGMVYGMEVVPWVDNTAFQVASKLLDENIEIPMARSLIPLAFLRNATMTDAFVNNEDKRPLFKCKNPSYHIDKYGYCCDPETLYNPAEAIYEDEVQDIDISARVCKPLNVLEKSVVKNNMANNGEFVARLDSIVRYRLNQLFTLEKCVSAVRAIPDKFEYYILKAQDTVKYDRAIEFTFTVAELRLALDPKGDYGLVKHLSRDLDEFIDMYYQPCVAALFGMNIGQSPGTDPQYFMAYPWYHHDECNHLSCLADNMRWDRETKGCIPSLMTGTGSPDYNGTDCSYDDEKYDESQKCKHSGADLQGYKDIADNCWDSETDPDKNVVVPVFLMDHFCLPQITADIADDDRRAALEIRKGNCTGGVGGVSRRLQSQSGYDPVVTWSQRDMY